MIKITESATTELENQIGSQKCLRLSIKGGGCSGYSYMMDTEDQPAADDIVERIGRLVVCIDRKASQFLDGLVIDYAGTSALNRSFKFANPNAKATCGCGTSFQPE